MLHAPLGWRVVSQTTDEVAPRDAATVVCARDGVDGVEVLLVRRHAASGFAADMWVFPGGAVDPGDVELEDAASTHVDWAAQAPRLGGDAALARACYVAAARETFEEAGILLAVDADGGPVAGDADAAELRRRLIDGVPTDLGAWLGDHGLRLDLAALAPWSRWVTPAQQRRRFDTRFFVAATPPGQIADHDAVEVTDHRWWRPLHAVAAAESGDLRLMPPTLITLREVGVSPDVASLCAAAPVRRIKRIQPHIERVGDDVRILMPDDADYPHGAYDADGTWLGDIGDGS